MPPGAQLIADPLDGNKRSSVTGVQLTRINHVGIRIGKLDRSVAFYESLGFKLVWHSPAHEVACLRNVAGIELNLIINSNASNGGRNILMDVGPKYPGYTHASFRVASIEQTVIALREAGIEISEGPVNLGGEVAVFVRDPDSNVIELAEIRDMTA